MAEVSLFLGNGLNRLSDDSASWEYVLQQLSEYSGMPDLMCDAKHKPFTLIYEQMALSSSGRTDDQLKEKVASLVVDYAPNVHHEKIMSSNIRHVMTTNYDYSLQMVLGERGRSANLKRETKYSVFRSRTAGTKRIWHVHGEAERKGSINLGFEQYSGQLQKLRNYATSNRNSSGTKSPFKLGQTDFDDPGKDKPFSWIDVFLRDDVHIVGYSLDYTEFDVWWLLTYKQKLRKSGVHSVGGTTYHDMKRGGLSDVKKAKHSILKSLGVDVKVHTYRGDSRGLAYKKALGDCLNQ